MSSLGRVLSTLLLTVLFLFIVTPMAVIVLVSVNEQRIMTFPPTGFSLHWWWQAFQPKWLSALWLSLHLGLTVAVAATALAIPAALALVRYRFPGRDALAATVLSPLLLPAIVTGVAVLQFIHILGLKAMVGFPSLLFGHLVVTAPYAVRTVMVSLLAMPRDVERAAMNLGADPWATFRHVTLPLIRSGVFASAVFSFILSFNNIPVSLFLSRPGATTIPIRLLQAMEYGMSPEVAAVAVFTVAINLIGIVVAERMAQVSRFIYAS